MEIDWNRVCVRLIEKARSIEAFATHDVEYGKAQALREVVDAIREEIAIAERVEDDRRHS